MAPNSAAVVTETQICHYSLSSGLLAFRAQFPAATAAEGVPATDHQLMQAVMTSSGEQAVAGGGVS